MLKNKGGFTLIELVMIIVILGILAAVAIPRYTDIKKDAKKAVIKGAYGAVGGQLQTAFAKDKTYPTGTDFETNVLQKITKDGWNYTVTGSTANTVNFNIWDGNDAYVSGDPYLNAQYSDLSYTLTSSQNNW